MDAALITLQEAKRDELWTKTAKDTQKYDDRKYERERQWQANEKWGQGRWKIREWQGSQWRRRLRSDKPGTRISIMNSRYNIVREDSVSMVALGRNGKVRSR